MFRALALAAVAAPLAAGQSETPVAQKGLLPVPDYSGDLMKRSSLTGDWGGMRKELADKGVTFDVQWTHVYQDVTSGGREEGSAAGGSADYLLKLDLMQMGVLPGALITARAESRYGNTVNGQTGLLLPANTDGFMPMTKPQDDGIGLALTELNYAQFLSEQFGVVLGKIQTLDADPTEFASGRGRYQFMNMQLTCSSIVALTVPYSTLAAGAIWMPTSQITVSSIVMNTNDASETTGFDDIGNGETWSTEAQTQYQLGDLPGGMNFGAIYAFNGDFSKTGGRLELTPGSGVGLEKQQTSWGAYWSGWQYLYAKGARPKKINAGDGRPDLEGVGVFARLATADQDTNPVEHSLNLGLGGRGLIPTRDEDSWGVGFFYNKLQTPRSTPLNLNLIENFTDGFEAFYNIAVTRSVALSVDGQWLKGAFDNVDDSVVFGLRLNVTL